MGYTATPVDRTGKPIGPTVPVEHHGEQVHFAVNDGSIPAVLERVGYDADQIKAALTAELARDQQDQRSSLIKMLRKRLTHPES